MKEDLLQTVMSSKQVTETPATAQADRHEVCLRGGHLVEIASRDDGATLRVRDAGARDGIEIEIRWSPDGPVARVRAARIDLETSADVSVRCKTFQVHAAEDIKLRAGGALEASAKALDLEARTGRIVARANDDVQLLGEEILLNCDRTAELPEWVTQAPGLMMGELLAVADASGDDELVAEVRDQRSKEHAPR
jgi:hypothetical protein